MITKLDIRHEFENLKKELKFNDCSLHISKKIKDYEYKVEISIQLFGGSNFTYANEWIDIDTTKDEVKTILNNMICGRLLVFDRAEIICDLKKIKRYNNEQYGSNNKNNKFKKTP